MERFKGLQDIRIREWDEKKADKKTRHDHLRITHYRICERECKNNLHFERRNVPVGGYIVHGIEESEITFIGLGWTIC